MGDAVITINSDRMGRRVFYKEEVAGEVVTHHKFVYDNYLCVQKLDALNNNSQLNLFVWDPTEPVATRPLFMLSNPGNYKFFYTFDGNKNVSELVHFESRNGIAAHYDYAPFGAITRSTNTSAITDRNFHLDNPFRFPSPNGLGRIFSSEYHDDTLGLVYYNYRHYNPIDGRWCGRDPIKEVGGINLYAFISLLRYDYLGLRPSKIFAENTYKLVYSVVYSECKCVDGIFKWVQKKSTYTKEYEKEITATFVWFQEDFVKNALKGINDEYLQDFVKDYLNGKTTEVAIDTLEASYPGLGKMLKGGVSIYEVIEHIYKIKNIVNAIAKAPEGSGNLLGNGDYYEINWFTRGDAQLEKEIAMNFDIVRTHVEPEPCTSSTKQKTYISAKLIDDILVKQGEWYQ